MKKAEIFRLVHWDNFKTKQYEDFKLKHGQYPNQTHIIEFDKEIYKIYRIKHKLFLANLHKERKQFSKLNEEYAKISNMKRNIRTIMETHGHEFPEYNNDKDWFEEDGICYCCNLDIFKYAKLWSDSDTIPTCESYYFEMENVLPPEEELNEFIVKGHNIEFLGHDSCFCNKCGLAYSWDREQRHTAWFHSGQSKGKMIENYDILTCNEIIIKSIIE